MSSVSKVVIAIATFGAAGSMASPALAQGTLTMSGTPRVVSSHMKDMEHDATTRLEAGVREMVLSKEERRAVTKIENALTAKNYPGAAAAIAAAAPVAKSADAKYSVAALQLRLGNETNDVTMQDQAIDAAIASGVAPVSVQPELLRRQAVAAILGKDYVKAQNSLGTLLALNPSDPDALVLLAETKNRSNQPAEALTLLERAIALKSAANQAVPPEWTRAVGVMKAKSQVKP